MHSTGNVQVQVCIDSVEMAISAERLGADSLELCTSLVEGGITPPLSLIQQVCDSVKIPVHVMIRPRGGDFLYNTTEFEQMKSDIRHGQKAGAAGVVFRLLLADGSVDTIRCKELVTLARPMHVTFHRAFDMTADPFLAMEEIITLGADMILTSGQRQTAEDGLEVLRELVKRAGGRITIMAGSGVNHTNAELLQKAGVRAIHFTARKKIPGEMIFKNESLVSMSNGIGVGEYDRYIFDDEKMRKILETINNDEE